MFTELVDPAIARYAVVGEGSAIAKPYSSATSLLAEFGPVTFAVIVIAVAAVIIGQLRQGRLAGPDERRIRTYLAAGAIFFVLLSLVENYLEFPQALLIPGLLYVIADRYAGQIGAHPEHPGPPAVGGD